MPRRKPTWKPATTTKITRLPPNGPKPGQSVDAWLHGKTRAHERLVDDPKTPFTDIN